MISEAAKKAALEIFPNPERGCNKEYSDFAERVVQSTIDAETDAALERAAVACEIVALEREKQLEDAKTPYTAQTRNAQAHECRKLADHIRALKRGSAK